MNNKMNTSAFLVRISSLTSLSLWSKVAGVLLIAVLMFGAVLYWLDYQYQQQLSAIADRGEPTSFAELAAYYGKIPPEQDTRDLWNQARRRCEEILAKMTPEEKTRFEELPAHEFYATEEVNLRLDGSWKSLPLVEEYLAPRSEILELVRLAAAKGGRTNPRTISIKTFTEELANTLSGQSDLRRTLWLATLRELPHHHTKDAVARIIGLAALYQSEINEPTVINGLIRVGILMSLCRAIEALCNQETITDDDLALCQKVLSTIDLKADLRRTLITERVFGIESFADELAHPFSGKVNWFAIFFERTRLLEWYAGLLDEIEGPWPRIALYCDEIDAEWTMEPTAVSAFSAAKSVTERFIFAEAFLRLAETSLAIRQFANQHHHAPTALNELVPTAMKSIPENPITGKPIQYSVDKEGVVTLVVDGSLFLDREPVIPSEEVRPKEITFRVRL